MSYWSLNCFKLSYLKIIIFIVWVNIGLRIGTRLFRFKALEPPTRFRAFNFRTELPTIGKIMSRMLHCPQSCRNAFVLQLLEYFKKEKDNCKLKIELHRLISSDVLWPTLNFHHGYS